MKKTLLSLALILLTAVSAMAQLKATISQLPTNDYSAVNAEFKLSDVANVLGTDADSLVAALDDGSAQFGLFDTEGLIGTTADGPGSYWMKADGSVTNWGNEAVVYNSLLDYDSAEDYFAIPFGQYPETFEGGETWSNTFTLKYGRTSATFEITFNIIAPTDAPVTHFSKLNIVKKYTATLDLVEGKYYENLPLEIEMSDLAEVLDCPVEAIADNIAKITIAREFIYDENQGIYAFTDSLINHRAPTDGWFGRYTGFDELSGEEYTITENAFHEWGAGCTVYLQNPTYAEGVYSITYGQYPGTLSAGDKDYITLYIVNGNKAAELTLNINVINPNSENEIYIDGNMMTLVGADTINIQSYSKVGWYGPKFNLNVEYIADALGCEINDLFAQYFSSENTLSSYFTSKNERGCWLDENGYVSFFEPATFFMEPIYNDAYAEWHSGHMPGIFDGIKGNTMLQTNIAFVYGNKCYMVHVNYSVSANELVETKEIYKEIGVSPNTFAVEGNISIDAEEIAELIGTTDFAIYTDEYDTEHDLLMISNRYTCDPAPGFWYGDTYYDWYNCNVENFNSSCIYAMSYLAEENELTFFKNPGHCHVGDNYEARIYFVNDENGKYVQYTVYTSFVRGEIAKGDVNQDGNVNVGDFSKEIDIILERDYNYDWDVADVNEDGWINVGDATAISNIILEINYDSLFWAKARGAQSNSISAELVGTNNGISRYAIMLSNTTPLSALQLDVKDARLAGQQMGSRANGQSIMATENRVIIAGLGAGAFAGNNGAVIYIDVEGAGVLENIIASDICGNAISFDAINLGETTCIAGIATESGATIYSANGVKTNGLVKGVNIIRKANGSVTKVIVK